MSIFARTSSIVRSEAPMLLSGRLFRVQCAHATGAIKWKHTSTKSGYEAARHVARGGKLPEKYRPAARRYLLAICSMTIIIGLSPILYRRVVLGEEPKHSIRPTTRQR